MEILHIRRQHCSIRAGTSKGDCEPESPQQAPVQLMALALRQFEHLGKLAEEPATPAVRIASTSK